MHKSAIFGLFLMASLLLGTSVNMNLFSSANAQGMGQYDNSYEQSTYGNDPYGSSSYDTSYSDDKSYDERVMTTVMTNNHTMVHNNHLMTNQDIIDKALTVTTATTKLRTKNMNVEQVHSKASSLALSNSVMLKSSMMKKRSQR